MRSNRPRARRPNHQAGSSRDPPDPTPQDRRARFAPRVPTDRRRRRSPGGIRSGRLRAARLIRRRGRAPGAPRRAARPTRRSPLRRWFRSRAAGRARRARSPDRGSRIRAGRKCARAARRRRGARRTPLCARRPRPAAPRARSRDRPRAPPRSRQQQRRLAFRPIDASRSEKPRQRARACIRVVFGPMPSGSIRPASRDSACISCRSRTGRPRCVRSCPRSSGLWDRVRRHRQTTARPPG